MARRKIIKIDEEKCNGCGQCIPNCPEGALQVIDNKVRLISDLFCDGLGACIGHCPEGAISVEEREAESYDERRVMENVIKQGDNTIKAHLEHLKDHGEYKYLKQALDFLKEKNIKTDFEQSQEGGGAGSNCGGGCPGLKVMDFSKKVNASDEVPSKKGISELGQWPIQIRLIPPNAPYFEDADLLVAADCVPFAYPDFHKDLLKGKILLIGCPKLDDVEYYKQKISDIIKNNNIKSITCAHMEVPCCFGLIEILKSAIASSGKDLLLNDVTISVKGERQ